jgi:hypothetical protein
MLSRLIPTGSPKILFHSFIATLNSLLTDSPMVCYLSPLLHQSHEVVTQATLFTDGSSEGYPGLEATEGVS